MSEFQQPDLHALALEQFADAVRSCGVCRSYHALWPYLRLTKWVGGIEADQGQMVPALGALLAQQPRRVLIAGSADTGVTALVHHASGALAQQHRITVVDRCATPLLACQRYARQHGLQLGVLSCDLRALPLQGVADVVVGHSILPWLDAPGRKLALRNLRHALVLGGHMVLNTRLAVPGQAVGQGVRPAGWAEAMNAGLLARFANIGMARPCGPVEFAAMVQSYTPPDFNASYADQDALERDLEEAGFEVQEWVRSGKGLAYMADGSMKAATRQGVVAVALAK